jgi:hypothetical protein
MTSPLSIQISNQIILNFKLKLARFSLNLPIWNLSSPLCKPSTTFRNQNILRFSPSIPAYKRITVNF